MRWEPRLQLRCIFRQSLRVNLMRFKGVFIGFLTLLILDTMAEIIRILVMNGTVSGDTVTLERKITSFLIGRS
jgi:hypothetical protein